MTFAQAKAVQARLEAEWKAAASRLASLSGGGALGLTPDHVKTGLDYRDARAARDGALTALRRFNAWFVPTFKRELQAERRA